MIPDLAAIVPPSLAPACAAMTIGGSPPCPGTCRLSDSGAFERALGTFASTYVEPDRAALVSFWSMYYLTALIVPATAALLCRDQVLPVGLAEIDSVIAPSGLVEFRLGCVGQPFAAGSRRFDRLVEGHLAPFVTLCTINGGPAPRVIWNNAAVVLRWVLDELRATATLPIARAEAEALLDGREGACRLAYALRIRPDGIRTRRVCCLRDRLPGVEGCGALCPKVHRDAARSGPT